MKIDDLEDLKFYEKAMQLALRMQECLTKEDHPLIVGVAAQKIASYCAHKVGLDMEKYLESCGYSFEGTRLEMKRMEKEKK